MAALYIFSFFKLLFIQRASIFKKVMTYCMTENLECIYGTTYQVCNMMIKICCNCPHSPLIFNCVRQSRRCSFHAIYSSFPLTNKNRK